MNWIEIVGKLLDCGFTQVKLAEAANCSQAFISDLKNGKRKDCSYSTGKVLVDLYESLNKKAAA